MGEVTCIKINSFQEYTQYLSEDNTQDTVLFRGQRADWPLIPKIARITTPKPVLEVERRMMESFQQQSLPFLDVQPTCDWDWLALAQHHGLPTRLLDWSLNPLVALWFTVRKLPEPGNDGVVWVFKPTEEDFAKDDNNPYSDSRTKAFRPKHITVRIRVQAGYFTVHKYLTNKSKFLSFDKVGRYKAQLSKLIVPAGSFPEMRYRLDQFGINQFTLFPDLDGLSSHIQWLNSILDDESHLSRDDGSWTIKSMQVRTQ